MAEIYKIKESELVGGTSNSDVYPVTSTQAVFSQTTTGSIPSGVKKKLEDRLQDHETKATSLAASLNDLEDTTYRKSQTYSREEVDNRINTIRVGLFVVAETLPTASVDTLGKIYLVDSVGSSSTKDEWITVDNNGTYAWENIGTTTIDLDDYSTTEEMEAALDALEDEILDDISDFSATVYTKEQTYSKSEIADMFSGVAQFKPEWGPNGQLPEPNNATMNRLFLMPKENPDKQNNNVTDEYITIRVEKYGPLGSWEGEEVESTTTEYEYRWEKIGDINADAYSIIDLGIQSDYIATPGGGGYYTIDVTDVELSEGTLYESLDAIWNAKKIPVIEVSLNLHTASYTIPLYKTPANKFVGHERSYDGTYSVDVEISSTYKNIYIKTIITSLPDLSGYMDTISVTNLISAINSAVDGTFSGEYDTINGYWTFTYTP